MSSADVDETSSDQKGDATTLLDPLGAMLLLVPALGFGLSFLTEVPALPVFCATVVTSVLMGVDASRLQLGSKKGEFPAPLWCALALVPILWLNQAAARQLGAARS